MRRQQLPILVLMGSAAAGCAGAADTSQDLSVARSEASPITCKNINLSGKVFYNDLRTSGRFADRKTILPTVSGFPNPYDSSSWVNRNYLGMLDGKIEVYELDQWADGPGCASQFRVGSTYIQADGTWHYSGNTCDPCKNDLDGSNDAGLTLAVKIVLEHCPATGRCFSVAEPNDNATVNHYDDQANWGGADWSRWYRGADLTLPRVVNGPALVDLGVDYFQEDWGLENGYPSDLYAQAANVFASLVDVTRRVHVTEGIPFDRSRVPKVKGYFPSVTGGTAHSHQGTADRLCVTAPTNDWIDGDETAHEYGHLLHYWQWWGTPTGRPSGAFGKWSDFCYDSDGDGQLDSVTTSGGTTRDADGDGDMLDECAESSAQREYAYTAFKEGWAGFIADLTFSEGGSGNTCEGLESRTPTADNFQDWRGVALCTPGQSCRQGRHFYTDVKQALCDLWDENSDVSNLATDRLALPLSDLLDALGQTFAHASPSDRTEVFNADSFQPPDSITAPLGLCAFTDELSDAALSMRVAETLAVTHIDCGGTWLYPHTAAVQPPSSVHFP